MSPDLTHFISISVISLCNLHYMNNLQKKMHPEEFLALHS